MLASDVKYLNITVETYFYLLLMDYWKVSSFNAVITILAFYKC